ncbi:MAG: hypothetical protein AAGJ31_01295 [Verrucomicrobiota bacterium]
MKPKAYSVTRPVTVEKVAHVLGRKPFEVIKALMVIGLFHQKKSLLHDREVKELADHLEVTIQIIDDDDPGKGGVSDDVQMGPTNPPSLSDQEKLPSSSRKKRKPKSTSH